MNLQINPAPRVSQPAHIPSDIPNDAIDVTASHAVPAETVVFALGSDPARGLDRSEAQRRLEQYGPNQLASVPEIPWWKRFLEQFENFLVIILLFAIVISVIEWLLQDPRESALPYEAIVITAIVVLNALLGFFQEARAERSVRALMALAAPESTVVREGSFNRFCGADQYCPRTWPVTVSIFTTVPRLDAAIQMNSNASVVSSRRSWSGGVSVRLIEEPSAKSAEVV